MTTTTLWIQGHVPSPNFVWRLPLRRRMATVKAMREKAMLVGYKEMVATNVGGYLSAHVLIQCHRARPLNTHDNLKSSVKHYVDGLTTCQHKPRCRLGTCPRLILPMGDDGPEYLFDITQTLVRKREEGTLVTITGPCVPPRPPSGRTGTR